MSLDLLEQVITLMKLARSHKMLVIDDEAKEIQLDPKSQNSLH